MNRDKIRYYKSMECDYFTNQCPNIVTSDSEGHESDNAALQVMATDTESCNTHDIVSSMEDIEYLNLLKIRMVPLILPKKKRMER